MSDSPVKNSRNLFNRTATVTTLIISAVTGISLGFVIMNNDSSSTMSDDYEMVSMHVDNLIGKEASYGVDYLQERNYYNIYYKSDNGNFYNDLTICDVLDSSKENSSNNYKITLILSKDCG